MIGAAKAILKKLVTNDKGEFSKMAVGGALINGYTGISTYEDSRQEGNGVITSALQAGGDLALGYLNMPLMLAKDFVPMAAEGLVNGYHALDQYSRSLKSKERNTPFQNATFVDSQQTYTMRQAGMNLARQGQYAAQQTTMGNEASSIAYNGL